MTQVPHITFIGAGNMAIAITKGLALKHPTNAITLCSPTLAKLQEKAKSLHVNVTTDNCQGAKIANIVVLAVKPAMITTVCREIRESMTPSTLVISVAAGITCDAMQKELGQNHPIIRCMPNTPCQILEGASGLFANAACTEEQREAAQHILSAVGITNWVDKESLIDSVTAVSGSGPAYYFLMMEAMIDAAQTLGLDKKTATELTLQTAKGAAILAEHSTESVDELRRKVTSPNGTTERAINTFEENEIREIFAKAMKAAQTRSQELAQEFSQ